VTPADRRNQTGLERVLRLLSEGVMEVEGLIPWSSNATLLVTVRDGDESTLAIYKPQRGERPLWDFPHGSLGRREVAAYLVAEALACRKAGLPAAAAGGCRGLVPPTVLREGPYGSGSVQLVVEAQEEMSFFSIQEDARYAEDLKRLAALDVICNNADRKAGHCLIDRDGRLWAIDNALTFHVEPKLRTVIWDFAGTLLPARILSDLKRLLDLLGEPSGRLGGALEQLLSEQEVAALKQRVQDLIRERHFPEPGPWRAVPWPLF
jgi:uncharacterized repeat protein (TIGR03843 family)